MKSSRTSDDEMIDYSFRVIAMARGDYELITQRASKYSRRHHRHKTKQAAEAHAAKWARRVKGRGKKIESTRPQNPATHRLGGPGQSDGTADCGARCC